MLAAPSCLCMCGAGPARIACTCRVGWASAGQMEGLAFRPGALMHSDRGTHYTSQSYRAKLRELGLVQSMSGRACCWGNACIESFLGRM